MDPLEDSFLYLFFLFFFFLLSVSIFCLPFYPSSFGKKKICGTFRQIRSLPRILLYFFCRFCWRGSWLIRTEKDVGAKRFNYPQKDPHRVITSSAAALLLGYFWSTLLDESFGGCTLKNVDDYFVLLFRFIENKCTTVLRYALQGSQLN